MASDLKTYRSPITGRVGQYHPRVAAAAGLIEVPDGAKPLAYTPIPQAAIEDLLGREPADWAGPAGDADSTDSETDEDSSASDVKE